MLIIVGFLLVIVALIGGFIFLNKCDTEKQAYIVVVSIVICTIVGFILMGIGIDRNMNEKRTFEIYNIKVIELDKNQTIKELNEITIVNPESHSEYYTIYLTDKEMINYNITKNSKTIKISKSEINDYVENKLKD